MGSLNNFNQLAQDVNKYIERLEKADRNELDQVQRGLWNAFNAIGVVTDKMYSETNAAISRRRGELMRESYKVVAETEAIQTLKVKEETTQPEKISKKTKKAKKDDK